MRVKIPFALLAIVAGALETAGGAQELIVQGILGNRTYPLVAGTLGTLAGALLLAAGIALLLNGRRAPVLAQAAAYVSVPVFILIGVVTHIAGWPVAAIGMISPLVLVLLSRRAVTA